MKEMTVICSVCNKVLIHIEKDDITQEDIDMYESGVICPEDGQTATCDVKSE